MKIIRTQLRVSLFSSSVVWRGRWSIWVYHPNQPGTYGDSIFLKFSDDSAFEFERNKWYEIEIAIRLNQVGSKNGRLYAKINQQSFSMPREFEFRKSEVIKLDYFIFSSFMGGDSPEYQASHTNIIDFDDIEFEVY